LLDDYAQGKDSGIIDLGLVGDIEQANLADLVQKTERYINRRIRTLVMNAEEYERLRPMFSARPILFLWTSAGASTKSMTDDQKQPRP
jgi:hypothetical protein